MGPPKGQLIDPTAHLAGGGPKMPAAYGYLLGQHLGDGHLVTSYRVPVLRVLACLDYPGICDEIVESIEVVRGRAAGVGLNRPDQRCWRVQSYWVGWPQLLPQHGPGMKHTRPIVLTDWQQQIVRDHPEALIRGLIHSDGCRCINRVTTRGKTYEYPRYLFSNRSLDIHGIFTAALDQLGIPWRWNLWCSISIARGEGVAILDTFVGPKT